MASAASTVVPTSPSPPSSSFRPRSPTKDDLKPNAHPYPIRTTSTAALARSNSGSASPAAARHHYVPTPPSPAHGASPAREGGRRGEYRGHRYSRSLSASEDMYTDLPPSAGSSSGNISSGVQGPRALPVPPGVSNNSRASRGVGAAPARPQPKRWTPAQLATHLGSAVSSEAGEWAARRGVGGRAFMRMSEEEMEAMGAPAALRPAARALRQEVLQEQLDASSPVSSSGSESGFGFATGAESPTRMSPTRMSPAPVDEEQDGEEGEEDGTPSRGGKEKRTPHIVASASPFTSPFRARDDASTSPFRATHDDAREREEAPRFRNGRVQGMVRSFESSGSESGSEGGSPERDRERGWYARVGGGGSGFRNHNGNGGSGFRNGGGGGSGSGFRLGGSGSGFRSRGGGQSGDEGEGEEDADAGGTMRPLPARPDGLRGGGEEVDLGATVRGAPAAGAYNGNPYSYNVNAHTNHTNGNASANANGAGGEEELTVEELLALDEQRTGGTGSWRRKGRRGRREEAQGPVSPQHTARGVEAQGLALVMQHTPGGRPLPAQPSPSASASSTSTRPLQTKTSWSGVHAWEADEGVVGRTVKRVSAVAAPSAGVLGQELQGYEHQAGEQERQEAEQHERQQRLQAYENVQRAHEQRTQEAQRALAEAEARGRARGLRWAEESAALRGMVDAFRVRLEEVERRVGVMEAAAAATPVAVSTTTETAPAPVSTPATAPAPLAKSTALSLVQQLDPRRLLALFAPPISASGERARGGRQEREAEGEVGPTTLAGLPSYVLLVGLGVCAVVLRVLDNVSDGVGAVGPWVPCGAGIDFAPTQKLKGF
ncbi:hypothetical protein DFH09DRAFT_1406422 [Mycena vulgaris]|nr:hypothetical protein DFH09DRAFT_1406422 [Mycena vulgaris]